MKRAEFLAKGADFFVKGHKFLAKGHEFSKIGKLSICKEWDTIKFRFTIIILTDTNTHKQILINIVNGLYFLL